MSTVLVSGLVAGLLAIAVTLLVERFGGIVGGLLGTVPTTIVPAAWGMYTTNPDPEAFAAAMGAVPVGMAVNGGFLWCWRVLPGRLPLEGRALLAGVAGLALLGWAVTASAGVAGMDALREAGVAPLWVGAVAFAALELGGLWACRDHVPAPKGSKPVGPLTLVARGALAAVAIGAASGLAGLGSPLLAGMASVFPAIFLTTMVSLWWSQGSAVPLGAVGPMILGSGAVSAYALIAAAAIPALGGPVGAVLSWVGAALCVTAPAWWWLNRRTVSES